MKYFFTLAIIAFTFSFATAQRVDAISGATEIVVSTGKNYVNEVFYNPGHAPTPVPCSAWDIAIETKLMTANLLVNNGNKVMLYTYPNGAAADWATVDTTGMTWTPMYNSLNTWQQGAFCMNATSSQFDMGWGVYDMSTHNIEGDSIFIIKVADEDYRKLFIDKKISTQNKWIFKFAKLDGSDETTVEIMANDYISSNFIYYSIINKKVVEHEPAAADWKLLFTRVPHPAMGHMPASAVLAKEGVTVQEVKQDGLDQASFNTYTESEFSDDISTIGWDWKHVNMTTSQYEVDNDVVYFFKDVTDGAIWKIYFTKFGGKANGNYTFMQEKLGTAGINDLTSGFTTVYPNPAISNINVISDITGDCNISIYSMSGELVYSNQVSGDQDLNKYVVNVANLSSGLYNVVVRNQNKISNTKFIKK